jgi:hypothetical protein
MARVVSLSEVGKSTICDGEAVARTNRAHPAA